MTLPNFPTIPKIGKRSCISKRKKVCLSKSMKEYTNIILVGFVGMLIGSAITSFGITNSYLQNANDIIRRMEQAVQGVEQVNMCTP